MTATLDDVTARKKKTDASAEQQAAAELVGWPASRACR
jgi:hypothetical protein